jgi:hypothetical protein
MVSPHMAHETAICPNPPTQNFIEDATNLTDPKQTDS